MKLADDARDLAKRNFKDIYLRYKSRRMAWLKDALRHDNFRYGMQYTHKEEQELLKLRQAPLPINITAAICETAEAMLTATSPIITVAPANFSNPQQKAVAKAVAEKYKQANMSAWYNSLGGLQYDKVVRDFDNVGHGLFYVIPKTDDDGEFNVDIRHLFWGNFYPDPSSKDPLYRDCEAQLISFVMNKKAALRWIQQFEPDLDAEVFDKEYATKDFIDDSPKDMGSPYVSWAYDKEKVCRVIVANTLEEQQVVRVIPKASDLDRVKFKTYLKAQLPDNIRVLQEQNLIELRDEKGWYLTETTSVGGYASKRVFPIQEYNIIPAVYDHRESPYPHGRVWYVYPIQRALNKFVLLTILNASLMNALKFIVEENTVVDEDSWNNFINVPGVRLKWRRVTANSEPPVPVTINSFPQAVLEYPKFLIYIMEYVSGIWSVMQGSAENAPTTFGGMQTMQSAASMKIRRRMQTLDFSLSQLSKVVSLFWKNYAPLNGVSSYIPKVGQVEEFDYNVLQVNEGGVSIVPETDLGIGFKDLRFTTSANRGYERASEAAQLTTIATQLSMPQLIPLILDRMDIPDVDKIVAEMNQVQQLSAQVQQQNAAIEQLQQMNQQKAKEIEKLMQKMTAEDFKTKWTRVLERFKGEFKRSGIDVKDFEKTANKLLFGAGSATFPDVSLPKELTDEISGTTSPTIPEASEGEIPIEEAPMGEKI